MQPIATIRDEEHFSTGSLQVTATVLKIWADEDETETYIFGPFENDSDMLGNAHEVRRMLESQGMLTTWAIRSRRNRGAL